jgi:polar amino acid transport system substrate-binding protein
VRLDAILTNLVTAQPRLNQDKRFKLAGAPLYEEPNSVAIEKGDPSGTPRCARCSPS